MGGGEKNLRPKEINQTRDDDYYTNYKGYKCYTEEKYENISLILF